MLVRARVNVANQPYCSADGPFDGRKDIQH
jgi:hypothetical protein